MKNKPIRDDNTILIVEYATSETASETVYDKVKRLIMNEPITFEEKSS